MFPIQLFPTECLLTEEGDRDVWFSWVGQNGLQAQRLFKGGGGGGLLTYVNHNDVWPSLTLLATAFLGLFCYGVGLRGPQARKVC